MSNYSTRGKEVTESTIVSKWIKPATTQVARIVNMEYVVAGTGSKGMKITFMTDPVKDLQEHEFGNGQIAQERLWLSEKARPYTTNKVILFADKLGVREELDNAMETVTSDEEYVTAANKVLRNVKGSFIFGGEEVALEDKETGKTNVWVKPTLYPYGSIGSVDDFGSLEERCSILAGKDKLIKKLDIAPTEATSTTDSSYDTSYDTDF
tara:strand:+ start:13514 stop:14140 length:627 start_codon:yes stop_codon:yes gene_type:complete